jgi:hypothetical protein
MTAKSQHLAIATSANGGATTIPIEPPGAGQYWRLRVDVGEANTKTAQHPKMKAGTVLLIKNIETQVDGTEHAVHMAAHPLWHENGRFKSDQPVFMYDKFLDLWEWAPDGAKVREREMADLQAQMQEVQQQMLAPPPADTVDGLLTHNPAPNEGGTGQELATSDGLKGMVAHAEATKKQAEKRVKWIQKHTLTLGGQVSQLACFHQEQAEALLAQANAKLKGLSKIFEIVKNLTLYTGEQVSMVTLCDGEPADASARLTFYQDVLAFDEELLMHIDAGGMDHRHLHELGAVLRDPAIADRLIPAQRGFVLVKFRGKDKVFFNPPEGASGADLIGAAIGNMQENAIAQEHRLLYRDGQKFTLISCPEVFPNINQLLPSTAEQNSYFLRERKFGSRRTDREDAEDHRITPEHLDYAQAQREQAGALNDYARVLILCWGLHDRSTIFDSTNIPKFSNWLDPGFQLAFLELVSHDNLIGEEHESYGAYRKRMNLFLGAGSTVIIDTSRERENAPGLFGPPSYSGRSGERRSMVYKPEATHVTGKVRTQAGRFYLEVTSVYDGYRSPDGHAGKEIKWFLKNTDENLLVLDRVHSEDLTYYLTSRKQRRSYQEYVGLFQHARKKIEERDVHEASVRQFLRAAVAEANLQHDPKELEAALTTAIAVWRSSRGARPIMLPGEEGWNKAREILLNALHSALTSHAERIAAVQALAERVGRIPLRLIHRGNDTWHLYTHSMSEEKDPRVEPWPWVADLTLGWDAKGEPSIVHSAPHLLRKLAGEAIIHDWPGAETADGAVTPENMSYAAVQAALDAAEQSAAAGWNESEQDWVALAQEARRWTQQQKGCQVIRAQICLPLGTMIYGHIERRSVSRPRTAEDRVAGWEDVYSLNKERPLALVAKADLWKLCYLRANAAQRKIIMEECARCYANPENARNGLQKALKNPSSVFELCGVELRGYAAHSGKPYFLGGEDFIVTSRDGNIFWGNATGQEAACWKRVITNSAHSYTTNHIPACRVTSLGPFGAAQFPELLAACEMPARAKAGLNATKGLSLGSRAG